MGCKAGWMLGGLLGVALVAGCGDGGGGVVTNSNWRMWSESSVTFAAHNIMGADGENMNIVQCSFNGEYLEFGLVDEGLDDFENPTRPRGVIEVRAKADGTICDVTVRELANGQAPPTPEYTDNCQLGCTVNFTADAGNVNGTLSCDQMKDNAASTPLYLGGEDSNKQRTVMTFSFEKCN